tara:strand:+ start:8452 stop:8700 length:249 start_codon:yes stop_codon:yes gene_type:complete
MKNFKDITISIFAIIGFVTILSSFNNQTEPQVNHGTPESHVWEVKMTVGSGTSSSNILFNKKTGEVKSINYAGTKIRTPKSE